MNQENTHKLTIVVPFLDERENLPVLYERLVSVLSPEPEDLEILFVDDGSTDGSAEWVSAKAKEDSRVLMLKLSRNFGHQIAITAGMDHADGDAVVIIDADLQDPPEIIPELLTKWREGHDVVYAVRTARKGEGGLKRWLAFLFYKVFRLMSDPHVDTPGNAGDFRLVSKRVVTALKGTREMHRFIRGLTSWVGFKQGEVKYERDPRNAGKTKYPMWKSANLAWDAITSFSAKPLRLATHAGILVSLSGGLLGLWIVGSKLLGVASERGWASLAALILFLGGTQLVCLGLIGQYLSRVFDETKKRPLYFVSEKAGQFRGASSEERT